MKVERTIRKVSTHDGIKERDYNHAIFLPYFFEVKGVSFAYFDYIDFQQLSLEELEKKWIEMEEKTIEWREERRWEEEDADKKIEFQEKIKRWKKEKNKIFEEKAKPEIIKIREKIKNGELLKTIWGFLYKDALYNFDRGDYTDEERVLLILELEDKERQKFERLKRKFSLSREVEKTPRRDAIPEAVRIAVWRRDEGKCAKCGSRKNLEYDHIIPVSKGGGNTVRNIELLCEECNRKKRDNIE